MPTTQASLMVRSYVGEVNKKENFLADVTRRVSPQGPFVIRPEQSMASQLRKRIEQETDRNVIPRSELADALGNKKGTPARIRMASCGLIIAPKEWVESVCAGLRDTRLTQRKADLCVRQFVKDTAHGPDLKVWVLFHVDDFTSAGKERRGGARRVLGTGAR